MIPFVDLKTQQERIRPALKKRFDQLLDHGKYIMGPEVLELESELAEYVGAKYAVSCSSGTDALLLSLMCQGIGPGDAVITTPFTFIATAEVISLLGATPLFVDIDPQTFNISPTKIESAIAALDKKDSSIHPLPKVAVERDIQAKAIIAVDLFGLPCDYEAIMGIAMDKGLIVIEDAAQSFGAQYFGRKACSLGHIGCTSFFPAKPLGGYGDGGMCFTNEDEIADTLKSLRIHGKGGHKYDNIRIGLNGRLDTMQAAILLEKFKIFPDELEVRQKIAQIYSELLSEASGIETPTIPENYLSAWAQYSILCKDIEHRSRIQDRLKQSGIPSAIYYPKPLHLQTAFATLGYPEGSFEVCERISERIVSLPFHPYLEKEQQEIITNNVAGP